MWLYLIIFFIPVIYYSSTVQEKKQHVLFLALFLLGLSFFVGLSDMFGGYDRYIYGEVFDNIADITSNKLSYVANGAFNYFPGERGYVLINIILSFFTENRYIFILIYTVIIYAFLFVSFKRYIENYPIGIIFFFGLWFFFTFTYLRQVLGATIVWLSFKYVIDRKLWKFIIVFLIACSIHKSAIIVFPVYFITTRKYSSRTIIVIALLLLLIGLSPIPNMLFDAYGDASIVERKVDYNASGGIRIPYLIEASLFLYIILKNYTLILDKKINIVMLNVGIIFCLTLLFFVRSENGGRLSWYFLIGLIATLTHIITKKGVHNSLFPLMVIMSLILYLRVYFVWQNYLNLYPYKTFLTNGFRKGDFSYENYEYDHKYDDDKLYRTPFRYTLNIKP